MADDEKDGGDKAGGGSTDKSKSGGGDGGGSAARRRSSRSGSRREGSYVDRFVRYRADGDPWNAVDMLLRDNRGYRETFRGVRRKGKVMVDNALMQRELEDLDAENKQYAEQLDGALVLKGDDRKEYEAFKKLNVKAADLDTKLKSHENLEREKKQRDGFKVVKRAADKLGLDAELFAEFLNDKNLELVHHDNDAGKKVWALKKAGDEKATPLRVEKFITKEFGEKRFRALEAREDDDEFDDDEDSVDTGGDIDIDDEDAGGDDDDDVDEDEDEDRPARRIKSKRTREKSRTDRTEKRRGVRIPASRGRQVSQSRGARGTSDIVRRTLDKTFVTPSQRAKLNNGEHANDK